MLILFDYLVIWLLVVIWLLGNCGYFSGWLLWLFGYRQSLLV